MTDDPFLSPVSFGPDRKLEWCPPGHGDLYPALLGSGTLDTLLEKGFKCVPRLACTPCVAPACTTRVACRCRYMFVSNSDNLGATMDLKLLTWFVQSGAPFAMEVAQRTDADKKGGHLARDARHGGLRSIA